MLYDIHQSAAATFERALEEILAAVKQNSQTPLRIVFFGAPKSNDEYLKHRQQIEQAYREAYPAESRPLVAYVAHAPMDATLTVEVTYWEQTPTSIEYNDDYIVIDENYILSGGLYSDLGLHTGQQADDIFERIAEILSAEGVSAANIVRQWNYIERITDITPDGQNYQLFNDSRSRFYNSCEWSNGYPAATGIGTQYGGVVVVFDVMRNSNESSHAIDNPLQISAHAYSQQVLINPDKAQHKTTPKFERARHVICADGSQMLYISGTAAIRGEESCQAGIEEQTALTMENIAKLAEKETLEMYGVKNAAELEYKMLRIYLKHNINLELVKNWFKLHYPTTPKTFLLADICREELLIEIEGIAAEK
jgi:enamine deaminase RidA (YjgF/YER057c/UK114 family)